MEQGTDDPHGRSRHLVQNIGARWADLGAMMLLPHAELLSAARADIATLVNQLQVPARTAQLQAADRAMVAEAALSVLGRLLQAVVATPALAAALRLYRLQGGTDDIGSVLAQLLQLPEVAAHLPPLDEARPALADASTAPGDAADVAAAAAVVQAIVDNTPVAQDLGGAPAAYYEEQAALLADDTGVEDAFGG